MKFVLLAGILLLPLVADAGCGGSGGVIDMRSEAQYWADRDAERLRCVVFVLAGEPRVLRQGWVEWHHERSDGPIESTRLGLYRAGPRGEPAFGRVPQRLQAERSADRLIVLLPTTYWALVNTTRVGWQLRAGLVDAPSAEPVGKLFTDVGLNAGLGRDAESLEGIADLARRAR
jgi:hypothetical protein